MLRFDDGINIDTSGELRAIKLSDGWYLIGQGLMLPAESEGKAHELLKELTQNDTE